MTEVYPLSSIARICCPEKTMGRPPKIAPAKAAFLSVVKEDGKKTPYRKTRVGDWVKLLKIGEVHYTTIHKAIKRLPPHF